MMEALKDRVWFEGVFIGLGGVETGGGTDLSKNFSSVLGASRDIGVALFTLGTYKVPMTSA